MEYFMSQTLTFIYVLLCGWKITEPSFCINFYWFWGKEEVKKYYAIYTRTLLDVPAIKKKKEKREKKRNELNGNGVNLPFYRRYKKICVQPEEANAYTKNRYRDGNFCDTMVGLAKQRFIIDSGAVYVSVCAACASVLIFALVRLIYVR